ncbi:type VI secretion system membrane subunit TssM [Sorangium sp. So ce861]|uniref:type VI secretion system membrane subunit TssM n=1 Tax=Sorangium sp. So ce861 TaxID=3133323 RepID=UPI003F61F6F5
MWLWILSALFLAAVWGVWFMLRPAGGEGAEVLPIEIPIAATAAVLLLLAGLAVYRRIRAARAARALEKAIAQQAQEQVINAKPERRAEIQELSRQMQEGIAALKASKLGGGRRGADALYVLPWYVMVGPPGAGKTTALRHSGLVFPYIDPERTGVRGVGGTRNCEWWFTNEAILLDTAGRYTTESDDHDEWMAFLELLLQYREHKPLNGVIVAVSMSELLDASDDQIDQTGKKIRARIDEMQRTLHMTLPVYVLFTKTDLVAGFTEYFGDLKKSERAQAWGATVRLDENKSEPGKIFDREFDVLIERLHSRLTKRLIGERSRDVKEKAYQFPLEFAAVKRNLSDFIAAAFAPGAGAAPAPILRGFYFTSGVQEGRPLDRVVGAMGRAFGLRAALGEGEEEAALPKESKSFFLHDVFTNVAFPDQDLAARSEAELRRRRMQRVLVAAVAGLIALLFLLPAVISYFNNKALVAETRRISDEIAFVDWSGRSGAPPNVPANIDKLDRLQGHVGKLDQYVENTPLDHGWFMFQGDKLFPPTMGQYIKSLKQGFVGPAKAQLEAKLERVRDGEFLDGYNALRSYLLLGKGYQDHMDEQAARWQTGRLVQVWADILKPFTDMPESDLKERLTPHVAYYIDLVRRNKLEAEELNEPLVARARADLLRVDPTKRYYDQFVTSLIDQKYDESGPNTPENLKYPPVSLDEMFADRPEVLTVIHSAQKNRGGPWFKVEGPYTAKGHAQVLESLKEGRKKLERELWVLPLSNDEKRSGDQIQKELDRVRQDYDNAYIAQWEAFFRDIQVDIPKTNRDAIHEFRVLSTPDWPYRRLLQRLHDETQFPVEKPNVLTADGGIIDRAKDMFAQRVERRTNVQIGSMLPGQGGREHYDPVPDKFESMAGFGVPAAPAEEGQPPPPPPKLGQYVGHLERLAGEMSVVEDGPPDTDTSRATEAFQDAVKETQTLLLSMDQTGQRLMEPLLMNPLRQAYKAVVRRAGGAASGIWEVEVWPHYRDKIKDRYPFNLASSRDASLEDAMAFFKPKDGVLWGFYETYLKGFHYQVGHEYFPKSHLSGQPQAAKPFTPFNANLYNCLRRADEITDALFGGGGAEGPKVVFHINMKTVSPIVSEVIFEVDGQKRLYRNEKEFWHTFNWPGEGAPGARIQVRGAGGLDEELVREGPWGIFRLFEAGTTTAQKDNDALFTVTWQMTAPPVTVTMEIRPTRGNHPFPMSFFRATNCPPSIGDRFGKG